VFDGDPREAVTQFRGILETRRKAEVEAHGGSGALRHPQWVDSALAIPSAPGPDGELMAGTDLDIEFDLHCEEPKAGMILAIGIDSSRGQVVYTTTTRMLQVPLEPFTGVKRLRFHLADCQFGPGKYFVHISVIDEIGVHLYDWPQAISFDMHDYRTSLGAVHIEPRFEIVAT
jgi:ABC-2 type transport system ATP-binding protein